MQAQSNLVLSQETFDAFMEDVLDHGFGSIYQGALEQLKTNNQDLFATLGYFAAIGVFTDDQLPAAEKSMVLTHHLVWRQALQ